MTTPSNERLDRRKSYREDVLRCFQRHPIFHFMVAFCLAFTAWSIVDALWPTDYPYPLSFRGHDAKAAIFAALFAALGVLIQRRRWKRRSTSSVND
jgi:hypothetical protein